MAAPFLSTNWELDTAFILPDFIWQKGNFNKDQIFKHLPFGYVDADEVQWDQYANMGGLMPTRSLGAAPDIITQPPLLRFKTRPGYYGLETWLEEVEMTSMRQPNEVNEALDIDDRLGVMVLNCSTLFTNRMYQTAGTFITSGVIENRNAAGQIVHREYVPNFQIFQPSGSGGYGPGWSANPALATPINDLVLTQTTYLQPGTSASFGKDSELQCNPITVNTFWQCNQVNQTFRSDYGATYKRGQIDAPKLTGENSIEELLTGSGLPNITINHTGYYATAAGALAQDPTQFTYTIPTNTFAWFGQRPDGQILGKFALTRNAGQVNKSQMEKYPAPTLENESYLALAEGIVVLAEYHKMLPPKYQVQVGANIAPFIAYYRALAGFYTG
jgi:hypothetical protein